MDETAKQRMDREADVFAMSLLMPSQLVRREWEKLERDGGHREEDIETMADLFAVSHVRMTIRLKDMRLIL